MCSASRVPLQDAHFFECEDAALFAHGGKSVDTQGNSPLILLEQCKVQA